MSAEGGPFPFTTSIFTRHTGVCIIHGTEKPCASTRIAGHSILTKLPPRRLALPSTPCSSRELNEKLSLSLSRAIISDFSHKAAFRTVSSPPREKYQNSRSPVTSWFDRSNEFSSKSSRPTCDTELVVAVTAIARGVSKLSRYFALIHPRAAPRSSKQEHRSPRSLNGVLFL